MLARGIRAVQNGHTTIGNRTWVDVIYGCPVPRSRRCFAALKRDTGRRNHYVLSFRARTGSWGNMAQLKNVSHFVPEYKIGEGGWRGIEMIVGGPRNLAAI